jgi:hypothetical protein
VIAMPVRPSGRVGKEVLLLIALRPCLDVRRRQPRSGLRGRATPSWKNIADAAKFFWITIAFSQILDFPGLGAGKGFPPCARNAQNRACGHSLAPFFLNFLVFCRKATCTPYLVRA